MEAKKVVLVTGITGQDGSYLSEHLLAAGYEVHGIIRRTSTISTERIDHIFKPESRGLLHYGDLTGGLDSLIYEIQPDLIFNLAAMSHVAVSFQEPVSTMEINALGVVRLLETIRQAEKSLGKQIRFYQASSSEMFGRTLPPQSESSYFHPASPYGCAKLAAYWILRTYRDSYGMFASNGILFNHESPRRGKTFVTRKITLAAARIALGLLDKLELGNLDAQRDWGHARDYTRAQMMILEHGTPDDWVVSTGETHTVREFAEKVFDYFNLKLYDYLVINEGLKRPNEVPALLGDSRKIRSLLGWKPEYSFNALITDMCEHDYAYISSQNAK
jgi:GDPmannose 4,6-dehydratase